MLLELRPEIHGFEKPQLNQEFLSLPGTGYDVKADVERFTSDVQRLSSEGKSMEDSIKVASYGIVENMRGYRREYVMRFCAFPNPIDFDSSTGERIVVAPKYANARLEDTVMVRERNGAVLDATKETVEILKSAPKGSLVVWTSPPGDAGWSTRSGEQVVYPDSITFAYYVNLFGQLEAMSFVTDMTITQNERLLQILSGQQIQVESAEAVVRTVVYKPGTKSQKFSLENVVDAMMLAKGSRFAREVVTFEEVRYLVRNRDVIVWEDKDAEYILNQFLAWVEENISLVDMRSQHLLSKQIARTVMDLVAHSPNYRQEIETGGSINYQKILEIMRSLGGCAGGGMAGGRKVIEAKFVKNCGKCGAEINSYICKGYICKYCEGIYLGC